MSQVASELLSKLTSAQGENEGYAAAEGFGGRGFEPPAGVYTVAFKKAGAKEGTSQSGKPFALVTLTCEIAEGPLVGKEFEITFFKGNKFHDGLLKGLVAMEGLKTTQRWAQDAAAVMDSLVGGSKYGLVKVNYRDGYDGASYFINQTMTASA